MKLFSGAFGPWQHFHIGIAMNAMMLPSFFEHMDQIDQVVAERLNKAHHTTQETINAHRHLKKPFQVGDWVWQLKPKPIGGVKLSVDGPLPSGSQGRRVQLPTQAHRW